MNTRQRLIEAAVECLTRFGFGGTTMPRVAEAAGVSPGPRQYYFPTREDLFEAVVDHLIMEQRRWYAQPDPARTGACKLRAIIDRSMQFTGRPEQIAMLEVRLALKHEHDLRERVGARIDAFEAANDQGWLEMLADAGLQDVEILALRRLMSAVSRGLAFEPEDNPGLQRAIIERLYRVIAPDPQHDS